MSRLDLGGLKDLWYRIGDVFARKTEAGHSLSISDQTITLGSVSGSTLSSVTVPSQSLSGLFASASISVSGNTFTITFYDVNGNYADSVSFTIY